MAQQKQWNAQIFITEDDNDDLTTARVVLTAEDGRRHESTGHARRNPIDRPVPEIGDELAVGRALSNLAAMLLQEGAEDVAQFAGAGRTPR